MVKLGQATARANPESRQPTDRIRWLAFSLWKAVRRDSLPVAESSMNRSPAGASTLGATSVASAIVLCGPVGDWCC